MNNPAVISSSSDSATSATTRIFLRSNRRPRSLPVPPAPFTPAPARAARRRMPVRCRTARPWRTTAEREEQSARSIEKLKQRQRAWRRRRRPERGHHPPRQRDACDSADQRQQHALGQQLPDRRPRLAPSASRTASSRCRAAARDSSRLATFAQAISSTAPTAPPSSKAAERICCRCSANASSTRTIARRGRTASGGLSAACERSRGAPGRARRLPARSSRRVSAARCRRSSCCSDSSASPGSAHRNTWRAAAA